MEFKIQERFIGDKHPVFFIAEAGVNHNGRLERAIQLIDVAAEAGADFVKFQTFSADRLITLSAEKADYQNQTTDSSESQYAPVHCCIGAVSGCTSSSSCTSSSRSFQDDEAFEFRFLPD